MLNAPVFKSNWVSRERVNLNRWLGNLLQVLLKYTTQYKKMEQGLTWLYNRIGSMHGIDFWGQKNLNSSITITTIIIIKFFEPYYSYIKHYIYMASDMAEDK